MKPTEWNIVLLGYRNDLARARVLEHLRSRGPNTETPTVPETEPELPARIFTGLAEHRARTLEAELEELGAQTALEPATSRAEPQFSASTRPAPTLLPSAPMVLLAIATGIFLWFSWPTQPSGAPTAGRRPEPPAVDLGRMFEEGSRAVEFAGTGTHAARANGEAVRLAESGRYAEAAEKLEQALRDYPDDAVLKRNLQTVLLNWGVRDLRAGQPDEAQRLLEEAARLGERREVLQALGVAYMQSGNNDAARASLESALELDGTETATMLALAHVYVEEDRRADALDLLYRAREAGAAGAELERMIARLGREVDAEWDFVEMESDHFRVSFADAEDPASVDLVLDALENAYENLGPLFDLYPEGRTAVVLYAEQDFHAATGTPDWAGAAFDGRIKLPVGGLRVYTAELDRMVRHEYAHSLIAELASGRCPAWLNEGLAVWAEQSYEGERLSWAKTLLARHDPLPLPALRRPLASLPAGEAQIAYAQSYLVVHALVDRYGDHDIAALLRRLGNGEALDTAFAAIYPDTLESFYDRTLWQLRRER